MTLICFAKKRFKKLLKKTTNFELRFLRYASMLGIRFWLDKENFSQAVIRGQGYRIAHPPLHLLQPPNMEPLFLVVLNVDPE